jgi:RNA ligase (TIGR02306 family)
MTGLAYIGKVLDIIKIPGAEKIESLDVVCGEGGRWRGCAQKGQFKVNDPCAIFLQDALLPDDPLKWPEFEFMKKYKYRVRMCKFLGTPSEVLIMPINEMLYDVGTDVTDYFGVTKYSKQIPLNMRGERKGNFPSFIPKTDEPNFQSVTGLVEYMKGKLVYVSMKYDGTSCTMYKKDDVFGVCSRNMELKDTDSNLYWKMAKKYDVINKIPDNYAFQMEIIGPGIQKNPLGLQEQEIRIFNVFDITDQKYLDGLDAKGAVSDLPFVFVNTIQLFHFDSYEDIRSLGEVEYSTNKPGEGVVIRTMKEGMYHGMRCSFKVINLNYKG